MYVFSKVINKSKCLTGGIELLFKGTSFMLLDPKKNCKTKLNLKLCGKNKLLGMWWSNPKRNF